MTSTMRGTLAIVGVLLLVGSLVFVTRGGGTAPVAAPGLPVNLGPGGTTTAAGQSPVADIKLELLGEREGELAEPSRNPFRFEAIRVQRPPATTQQQQTKPPVVPVGPAPSGPAPPPAIALKFIGLLEPPGQRARVAILSDTRGGVFYGKEGDIIEGRYKVLRIDAETADLSYVDGRGRQTIRLSGQ
jgi:hypothetical protein